MDNLASEIDKSAYGGHKAYNLNCPLYRIEGVGSTLLVLLKYSNGRTVENFVSACCTVDVHN